MHVCMCHVTFVLNSNECRDCITRYLRLLFPITSPRSLLSAKTCNSQFLCEGQGSREAQSVGNLKKPYRSFSMFYLNEKKLKGAREILKSFHSPRYMSYSKQYQLRKLGIIFTLGSIGQFAINVSAASEAFLQVQYGVGTVQTEAYRTEPGTRTHFTSFPRLT